jgi:drug/metabolite transporter (DMT)-like permease
MGHVSQTEMSTTTTSRDPLGYALVAASFVIVGVSGSLVSWATAPSAVLLFMRLAVAALALDLLFVRRASLRAVARRDLWSRLVLMSVFDSGALLCYFFAIRTTGVAIATFLLFIQPVWVALLAPRFLRTPTEKIVVAALGVALAGLLVILAPALLGGGVSVSALGLAAGLAGGWCYAFFQLIVKRLTEQVPSTTIVSCECTLDALFVLPFALWQGLGAGVGFDGRDLAAALILGLLCTALAYAMWVDGVARIRVQHSSILGFLTPAVAPVFAWVLLGQGVGLATALGGALIVAGGLLVAAFGRAEAEATL